MYTTLDLDLQNAAESAIGQNVPQTYPGWDVGAVISSVQVGTGRVLAMAQNRTYSQDPAVLQTGPQFTSINYNTDFDYGGSRGFQPGSSYKVFTLAEWLKEGHGLSERVDSQPKSQLGHLPGQLPRAALRGQLEPAERRQRVRRQLQRAGVDHRLDQHRLHRHGEAARPLRHPQTAEAFGVHRADGDPLVQGPSSVIGTNEVAPLSMAVAFAGIANNGVTCTPIAIDRIVGRDGEEIPAPVVDAARRPSRPRSPRPCTTRWGA